MNPTPKSKSKAGSMPQNLHAGHRQRLKNRFLTEGLKSFEEHQIYELLLFYSIPRRDTNPIAHILLNAFSSFSGVMDADEYALMQTDQIGEATVRMLKLLPEVFQCYYGEKFSSAKRFLKSSDTAAYIQANFPDDPLYTMRVSCFDNGSHLLSCTVVQENCRLDDLPPAKKILAPAIKRGTASIVLSIKLPFFSKSLTRAEYDALLALNNAIYPSDICFQDYLVFVEGKWVSIFEIQERSAATNFKRIPRVEAKKKPEGENLLRDKNLLAELLRFTLTKKDDPFLLAERLLEHFPTLAYVLDANYAELITIDGVSENTATFLKLIPPLASHYGTDKILQKGSLCTLERIVDYLIYFYVDKTVETPVILCFDENNILCFMDTISEGTVSSTYFDTRKVIEIAYAHHASSVILAHNHPSGVAIPSENDIGMTADLEESLQSLGICLKDHLLIAGKNWMSIFEEL